MSGYKGGLDSIAQIGLWKVALLCHLFDPDLLETCLNGGAKIQMSDSKEAGTLSFN